MITGNREDYLKLAKASKDPKFQIICFKNFVRVLNKNAPLSR